MIEINNIMAIKNERFKEIKKEFEKRIKENKEETIIMSCGFYKGYFIKVYGDIIGMLLKKTYFQLYKIPQDRYIRLENITKEKYLVCDNVNGDYGNAMIYIDGLENNND